MSCNNEPDYLYDYFESTSCGYGKSCDEYVWFGNLCVYRRKNLSLTHHRRFRFEKGFNREYSLGPHCFFFKQLLCRTRANWPRIELLHW